MAEQLPELMVLKCEGYVNFRRASEKGGYPIVRLPRASDGYPNCGGESVFDPYAKIAVERSSNRKYVHLRFCATNKYWGRPVLSLGDGLNQPEQGMSSFFVQLPHFWIVACADKPDEDMSKPSCTLFLPTYNRDDGRIRIKHAPSGNDVSMDPTTNCLVCNYLMGQTWFSVVDWDTLVKLPKRVAFKQSKGSKDNDDEKKKDYRYVEDVTILDHPYLQVGTEDGNGDTTAFEVLMLPDGHVHVKSVYRNKFWRRDGANWIGSDSEDQTGDNKDTLFWPVKVDDKTVALRNAGNNHFIKTLSASRKDACLSASSNTITNDAKFIVEELVLKRSVYNIRYRMEDARIFDETPFVAGVANANNDSHTESSMTLTVKFEENTSATFSNSITVQLGGKAEFEAGIPFIFQEKIEVSAEGSYTHEWNETTGSSKSVEASYTLKVPPKSSVHVSYVGTRGTCSVPFSYTQHDKSSTDGQIIRTEHIDGVYTGVSCYNYHFEQPKILPL